MWQSGSLYVYLVGVTIDAVSLVGNAIVLMTILRSRPLRRQFVLVCALSSADGVCGLLFVVQDSVTVASIVTEREKIFASFASIATFWSWASFFVVQFSSILCFLIALDRLLCVYASAKYYAYKTHTIHVGVAIVGVLFALISSSIMFVFVGSSSRNCSKSSPEEGEESVHSSNRSLPFLTCGYVAYQYVLLIVLDGSSFCIYIFIFVGIRQHYQRLRASNVLILKAQKQQHQLTMTLGLVMVLNVFCSVVPSIGCLVLFTLGARERERLQAMIFVGYLLFALTYAADVAVYSVSNRLIRRRMADFLRCRSAAGTRKRLNPTIRVIYAHYHRRQRRDKLPQRLCENVDDGASNDALSTSVCDIVLSRGWRQQCSE